MESFQSTEIQQMADAGLPKNYYWNFAALTLDGTAYFLALAFIDLVAVLPLFFHQAASRLPPGQYGLLRNAPLLAGFAIAIRGAGWLLPQLFSARLVSQKPRKKPSLVYACLLGRAPFVLVAIYLYNMPSGAGPVSTAAAIASVLAAWVMLSVTEGFAGVPWLFIIAQTIPARRRGSLFGLMQVAGGILALGAAVVVNKVLGPQGPPFPRNFGILFGLMALFVMISELCLTAIREPHEDLTVQDRVSMSRYLRQVPVLLRANAAFRQVVIVQLFGSFGVMASPLFSLYGVKALHSPPGMAGRYLSADMVGMVIGSVLFSAINDRVGPRSVIRFNLAAAALAPWSALLVATLALRQVLPAPLILWLYSATFFFVGVTFSGMFIGYDTYVLEIAPPDLRADYVGIKNTLAFPMILMPIIGSIASRYSGPEAVFFAAGCGSLVALGVSRSLHPTGSLASTSQPGPEREAQA